jgi:hypothetical protein
MNAPSLDMFLLPKLPNQTVHFTITWETNHIIQPGGNVHVFKMKFFIINVGAQYPAENSLCNLIRPPFLHSS